MADSRQIWQRVEKFNQQRHPELLAQKYTAMSADRFGFFRGSCHLFHEDWPRASELDKAPLVWLCGDLHLENFGVYKGDDRQVYFGINDFDEGARGCCTRDVVRLVTSGLLLAKNLGLKKGEAIDLGIELLTAYQQNLAAGQARTVTIETGEGAIAKLLRTASQRSRSDLLARYANDGQLKVIPQKILDLNANHQTEIVTAYQAYIQQQSDRHFFQCLDVKRRIAGLGSLGVDRYLMLIEGKGKHQNYLLDIKEQTEPAILPYLSTPQQLWDSSAARVLATQSFLQFAPPALRGSLTIGDRSFTVRELQPSADKLDFQDWQGKTKDMRKIFRTAGSVTAWSHLYSSGKLQAATVDELQTFARDPGWVDLAMTYGRSYAKQVKADWQEFRQAFQASQAMRKS